MKRALVLATVSLTAPFAAAYAQLNEVLVIGDAIEFRNRTADINPVLSYDLEYFQRFEPVSVGEMLKRVPGVTFTDDVGEYDGVQMRVLSPEYSQIMINGRRMPGGENDGASWSTASRPKWSSASKSSARRAPTCPAKVSAAR